MLIESALVCFGVIETFNQAFWKLSSGMSRGKVCSLSGRSTSTVTTGSEGTGVEGTGSPVCFCLVAGAPIACGEVLISVSQGMAVDWLVPDVEAGGTVLRKGSCRIYSKDSADGPIGIRSDLMGLDRLGFNKAALESLICQVRQGVLWVAVQG